MYGLRWEVENAFRDFTQTIKLEQTLQNRAFRKPIKSQILNYYLAGSDYGYTSEQSYMDKILQRCGYLNSNYINTSGLLWKFPGDLAQIPPF